MTQTLLRVRDLTIEFGPRGKALRVVDGVGFDLEAGGCIGIVGESGSGKSMTALSLLRLIPEPPGRIAAGCIELDGRDILRMPLTDMPALRGKEIAMIFQEPMNSLNPVMTIGAQIAEVLLLHEPQTAATHRARVLELLNLVGISSPEQRLHSYPHEFSGGMRQRVMIAMALACHPKILVADEPTTALDVTIQAQILDLINHLRTQFGMAIILVSHDLSVIADMADQVLVMYCGRIVESGGVADIFAHPAHPYTVGLLRSIPGSAEGARRLYQIPGSVPSPFDRGPGCSFLERCPKRMDVCSVAPPPLLPVGPFHAAACYAAPTIAP
jgi:oligopeptide/dipeptide ABC transporter ATP-binding protein